MLALDAGIHGADRADTRVTPEHDGVCGSV